MIGPAESALLREHVKAVADYSDELREKLEGPWDTRRVADTLETIESHLAAAREMIRGR